MPELGSERRSNDLEGGSESAPLLTNEGGSRPQDNGSSGNWKDYPAQLWSQTNAYLQSWRQSRSERGKQRQVDTDIHEPEQLHIPTLHPNATRLQNFKTYHPGLYWTIVALSSLILLVLLLLILAIAHLFVFTLRSPSEDVQQQIMAKSFSLDGPDSIEVLNLSQEGMTVSIQGRIGIDGKSALDEWLGERRTRSWYNRKERDVIEWAAGKIKGVQVDVGQVSVRSPDWSIHRKVNEVNLIPDGKEGKDDTGDGSLARAKKGEEAPQLPPTDLVTFNIETLYVPIPSFASRSTRDDFGGPEATTALNLTVLLKPSGPDLMAFAQRAIKAKKAILDVNVARVQVRGLNKKEWSQKAISTFRRWSVPGYIDISMGESWKRLGQKIPSHQGNDSGGVGSGFLNLTRYDFFEIGRDAVTSMAQRALGIKAYAEAQNPLGKLLKGHVEYSLPFGVFLPLESNNKTKAAGDEEEVVLLAAVATEPIDIAGEDKIQLELQGRVVPPPMSPSFGKRDQTIFGGKKVGTSDAGADALSGFLSRFLRGEANTVIVHGGSPFAEPLKAEKGDEDEAPMPGGGSILPDWLDKLLRTINLPIAFPGSKVTDLIQNVTIEDLKITPHPFEDEKLLCSGTIKGIMNLPGQLATVDVDITDLWPDILVYNGKPPSMKHDDGNKKTMDMRKRDAGDDDGGDIPTPDPLPSPLPEHAFGRVVPHSWAPAKTYIDPEDPKKQRKLLYSELKDVPFTVLPGRSAEFRSFSWKVVTGEGARAGIEGKARAKIWNSGLGKLVLSNLPVKGVFTVGKRGSGGNGDGDGDDDDGILMG
ncbi:hypothetical protein CBS101457_006271 [Exobasidium rhododendri]|nr:hypothetical protein CBS101457_006271 [Exobasidium rhododendri]